ncbi:type VI secretion system baseplate subunit TssF [Budvicia aquatica]|uniref:Type VI secretion system baseplate subunit TssF n=3 Tax=Budvicia aquatica TaxID=82979 RepID=A0A2C6CYF7_9GAMM|nr:type VI secretion system baseplate subunit TssF [Budvicia aquatica]PHI31719.1 type VI secretion system baseplate subunit TssF [Budvicia aquatica]
MSLERHFQDEITFIKSTVQDFADAHPQLPQFIIEESTDPDVERLLDGLAFLTGTLKAKLEQDFPELVQSLLMLLWPNYLRPTPSMTILNASVTGSDNPTLVTKGTVVSDNSLEQPACTFRSCRDLLAHPLNITNTTLSRDIDGEFLFITFSFKNNLPIKNLNQLQLYLGSDNHIGYQLYLMLSHYMQSTVVVINEVELPVNLKFSPVGMTHSDAMLPYPANTNLGNRLLQEYFCFPEGFLFLNMHHNEQNLFPANLQNNTTFGLKIRFTRSFPKNLKIRKDSIRINCVPAVNLFQHDGEPVILTGKKTQYPLVPSYKYPDGFEIFSVEHVESCRRHNRSSKNSNEYTFLPFDSFEHQIQFDKNYQRLYYNIKQTQDVTSRHIRHWISFVRGDEELWQDIDETISVRYICTNKDLPSHLRIGDISTLVSKKTTGSVLLTNITRPTMQLLPMLDESQYWTTISKLAQNYKSLLNPDSLKQILLSYDFPAMHNRQSEKSALKKLSGIQKIETQQAERKIANGLVVRGSETSLYIKQSVFNSEGELYLFGTVLAQFFSQYATLNSFHLLTMVNTDNQERYTWPVNIGQHSLI